MAASLKQFVASNKSKAQQSIVSQWWNSAASTAANVDSPLAQRLLNSLSLNSLSSTSSGESHKAPSTSSHSNPTNHSNGSVSIDMSANGHVMETDQPSPSKKLANGKTNQIRLGGVGMTSSSGNSWSAKFFKSDDAFGLSRMQRMMGFFGCMLAGAFCFGVASLYIPLLVLKARKFAALYSLGSVFFIFSFSLLWGPWNYVKHLFSAPRLPVTGAYLGTLIATLYTALWMRSTLLTIVCATAQFLTLIWFLLSYIPGGETGLRFMTNLTSRFVKRTVSGSSKSVLPV